MDGGGAGAVEELARGDCGVDGRVGYYDAVEGAEGGEGVERGRGREELFYVFEGLRVECGWVVEVGY